MKCPPRWAVPVHIEASLCQEGLFEVVEDAWSRSRDGVAGLAYCWCRVREVACPKSQLSGCKLATLDSESFLGALPDPPFSVRGGSCCIDDEGPVDGV